MPHAPLALAPDPSAPDAACCPEVEALRSQVQELTAELHASRERYRRLTENAPTIIFTVDEAGVVREINPLGQELLGGPDAPVVGRHFSEFVAPEDLDSARAIFQAHARDPVVDTELRLLRHDGERRLAHIHSVVVREGDRFAGRQGMVRDITDERAREMHVRRAERMASVAPLLSGVCHELNNPLTSIKSFAELLLLDDRPPEDREAMEIVFREAHRAAKIVSDLRLVARQGRGGANERGPVQVNEVVAEVLEQRSVGLESLGIGAEVGLQPDLPEVWAVRGQLQEVLHQLVSNAEQAMQDAGERRLVIRTRREGRTVALVIEDTGCGIAEEHRDRIFDPFWTSRGPEGTGLGLSIVHGIVTDHGGTIVVDSRPGHGTWVTVAIPVLERPPVAVSEAPAETASDRPLRVLVADDEAAIRFSLTRYLERRGHRVEEACDGAQAVTRIEEADASGGFDIIVADLRMPGLTGPELWKRLASRGDALAERIIFITGDTHLPEAEEELRTSGVPMVQKPFELAEIAQIIETHAGVMRL